MAALETQVGGAYMAAVSEAAPALPEIAEAEEETELAEEPGIAPAGMHTTSVRAACACTSTRHRDHRGCPLASRLSWEALSASQAAQDAKYTTAM